MSDLLQNVDYDSRDHTVLEETDFIPIEEIEPDENKRRIEYLYVTHQKKKVMLYNIDGKEIKRTIKTNKLCGKKNVLERRNWKPFGEAVNGNKGITTIGAPVYLELCSNNGSYKKKEEYSEPIKPSLNTSSKKKASFSLSTFKPSEESLKKTQDISNNFKSSGGYIPSFIKDKINESKDIENFSIVVKNFPLDKDKRELEFLIKNLFKQFGTIDRVKVLTNKFTGEVKDIAFVDFCYGIDAQKALKSQEKLMIDYCILSLEKANNN